MSQLGNPIKPCMLTGTLRVTVKRFPLPREAHFTVVEVTRVDDESGARRVDTHRAGGDPCRFALAPGQYRVSCQPSGPYAFCEEDAQVVAVGDTPVDVVMNVAKAVRLFRLRLFRGSAARSGRVDVEVYDAHSSLLVARRGAFLVPDLGLVVRIQEADLARAKSARLWFLDASGKRTTDGLFLHLVDDLDPRKDGDAARMLWALGLTELEPRLPPPPLPGKVQDFTRQRLAFLLALGWFQRRIGRDATLPEATARERLGQYYRTWSADLATRWRLYAPRSAFAGTNVAPAPPPPPDPKGWDSFHDYLPDPPFDTTSLLAGSPPPRERQYSASLERTLGDFHETFMNVAPAANVEALEQQALDDRDAFVRQTAEAGALTVTRFDPKTALASEVPALRRRFFALLKNMTWPDVKSYFLDAEPADTVELRKKVLVGALNFRQAYFWRMLGRLAEEIGGLPHDARPLFAKSVGSTDLTSDIDVTMSGSLDVPAMQRIYELVKAKWGKPSPQLFDVMFYGRDWMMVFDNIIGDAERTDEWFQVRTFDPVMDLYGLAAILRFGGPSEWEAFVASVRHDVGVPGLAMPPMFARIDLVEPIYDEQYVRPAARALEVAANKDRVEGMLHDRETQSRYLAVHNALNVRLMATARCDEGLVFEARPPGAEPVDWEQYDRDKSVKKTLEGGVGAAIAWIERQNVVVPQQALFAHEGYLTGGAMVDVVGTQGGKSPPDMTIQHLLQSFNDQAGNAFKELYEYLSEHEHEEGERAPLDAKLGRDQPHLTKGAWRASKYELRMGMALQKMTRMLGDDARVQRRREFHEVLHGGNPSLDDEDLAALRFECAVAERFDAHLNQLLLIRKAKVGEVSLEDMLFQLENGRPPRDGEKGRPLVVDVDPLRFADRIMARATRPESPMMLLLRDPAREKYTNLPAPPVPGDTYVWSYRTLIHYLVTHAAIVNRGVRRLLGRGPNDTYVRKLGDDA